MRLFNRWLFSASFVAVALISSGQAAQTSAPVDEQTVIAGKIGALFQQVMGRSNFHGQSILKRPVFTKSHGCVKAKFEVNPELPESLRIGVFAGSSYPAWVRFANDGGIAPDKNPGARGMSVKLVGVAKHRSLPGDEEEVTQDFVMQNHPVFFVDTAEEFLKFTEAIFDPSKQAEYDATYPHTQQILGDIEKRVLADPLDGQYWTPTPYRLGRHAMKYMVKPCVKPADPSAKPMTDANYLRKNMATHLKQSDACFQLFVQVQSDEERMPLDRATVAWDESVSPFIHAATLTIPKDQDIDTPARDLRCESLSFTGWHALPEHEPLGSINFARGIIYKRLSEYRRQQNKMSLSEPTSIDSKE